MLIIVLAILAAVAVLLALFGGQDVILGLEPAVLARVTFLSVILLAVSGGLARRLRHDWRMTITMLATWIGIALLLLIFYAYRFTIEDAANRVLAEIVPGMAISARDGEVMVVRDNTGSFVVSGKINGIEATLVFDTGASSIVLTAETAAALGFKFDASNYWISVSTANGRTQAAPVKLDSLSIGAISERNIEALAAKPGALRENLLGMSFLERLASYEVRQDKLILRQR